MKTSDQNIRRAYDHVKDDLGRSVRWKTFHKRFPKVHEKLVETAKSGELITHGNLASYAGTSHRHYLNKLLDGIEFLESRSGNPPLTVLVVKSNTKHPSDGFWKIVDRYGLQSGYESNTEEGLIDEITDHVHQEYSSK